MSPNISISFRASLSHRLENFSESRSKSFIFSTELLWPSPSPPLQSPSPSSCTTSWWTLVSPHQNLVWKAQCRPKNTLRDSCFCSPSDPGWTSKMKVFSMKILRNHPLPTINLLQQLLWILIVIQQSELSSPQRQVHQTHHWWTEQDSRVLFLSQASPVFPFCLLGPLSEVKWADHRKWKS